MEDFTVTKEWLHKHRTPKGGYNTQQLAALGMRFPLESGWMDRVVGMKISVALMVSFEEGAKLGRMSKKQKKDACEGIPKIKKQKKQKKITRFESPVKVLTLPPSFVVTDDFLRSYEWRKVRMQALTKYGAKCQCCGATPADGVVMNVDHIKPRRKFPMLALDVNNLQVLCNVCNHGKGNWDSTDWRPAEGSKVDDQYSTLSIDAMLRSL